MFVLPFTLDLLTYLQKTTWGPSENMSNYLTKEKIRQFFCLTFDKSTRTCPKKVVNAQPCSWASSSKKKKRYSSSTTENLSSSTQSQKTDNENGL